MDYFSKGDFRHFNFLLSNRTFLLHYDLAFLLQRGFQVFLRNFHNDLQYDFHLRLHFYNVYLRTFVVRAVRIMYRVQSQALCLLQCFFRPIYRGLRRLVSGLARNLYLC